LRSIAIVAQVHRPNGFRANSFLVVAAIVDVGAALIVPFEVINEFGDEDVGPALPPRR
jgi:hypothetical protein